MKPTLAAVATVLLLLLAGCSSPSKTGPEDEADFDELGLEATETTGVIRGVVVDDAIRPVAGALVALALSASANRTTESAADGAFGFDGLEPGTYFLSISKLGHRPSQTSAEVVAGVNEPGIVKVLLVLDPTSGPRVEALQWTGFVECSFRPMVIAADCGGFVPSGEEGDISRDYNFTETPDWIQVELLWKSTQAAGDEMSLDVSCLAGDDLCPDVQVGINESEGRSPLMLAINRSVAELWQFGQGEDMHVRIFAFDSDADVYDENLMNDTTGGQVECVRWPIIFDACIRATGPAFIFQQKFDVYVHTFYGYLPPDGWTFVANGPPPGPPEP